MLTINSSSRPRYAAIAIVTLFTSTPMLVGCSSGGGDDKTVCVRVIDSSGNVVSKTCGTREEVIVPHLADLDTPYLADGHQTRDPSHLFDGSQFEFEESFGKVFGTRYQGNNLVFQFDKQERGNYQWSTDLASLQVKTNAGQFTVDVDPVLPTSDMHRFMGWMIANSALGESGNTFGIPNQWEEGKACGVDDIIIAVVLAAVFAGLIEVIKGGDGYTSQQTCLADGNTLCPNRAATACSGACPAGSSLKSALAGVTCNSYWSWGSTYYELDCNIECDCQCNNAGAAGNCQNPACPNPLAQCCQNQNKSCPKACDGGT